MLKDHDLVLKDIGGQKVRDEYIKEKSWEKSKKKIEYHVTIIKVEMMSDDDVEWGMIKSNGQENQAVWAWKIYQPQLWKLSFLFASLLSLSHTNIDIMSWSSFYEIHGNHLFLVFLMPEVEGYLSHFSTKTGTKATSTILGICSLK